MRIQFYPSEKLEKKLINEAEQLEVSVSILVNDLLNKHYGLIPATSLSNSELRKKIFEEISDFVTKQKPGRDVCGKINLHTIAAQKYITPQAA